MKEGGIADKPIQKIVPQAENAAQNGDANLNRQNDDNSNEVKSIEEKNEKKEEEVSKKEVAQE